jgi:REP element-mobilizing transposase RayT
LSLIDCSYFAGMSVHIVIEKPGIYFVTFTCFKWIHLIELTNAYDQVYKFLEILNKSGHELLGYTIMPNHVHFLLYFRKQKQSLNTIIGNGKRFIGYEIIKRLNTQKQHSLLTVLREAVDPSQQKRNKQHEVWQGTFDVKECRTEAFILQKLNYMHLNPCHERWRLARKPSEYQHSSAAFYQFGKQGHVPTRDYQDFLALLLEKEEDEGEI